MTSRESPVEEPRRRHYRFGDFVLDLQGGFLRRIYMGEDRRLYRMKEDGSSVERIAADPVAYLSMVSPDGRWAVAILPKQGVETTSLGFVSLRGEQSFAVCNEDCGVGPRSFLSAPPFSWSMDGKWMFVNLVYFGKSAPRTAVLPYDSVASSDALWPKGLRIEKDIIATHGAKVINAPYAFPAAGPAAYMVWRGSTQRNLYRVRIPD